MYARRYNTRVKNYPDGEKKVIVANRGIFRDPNELDFIIPEDYVKVPKPKDKEAETRADSLLRAKSKIIDITRMNSDFVWFVTLTFNPERVDSKDEREVLKVVKNFLSNNVQRKGLKYVLVAEYHKRGTIHFHGFINDVFEMRDSGTVSIPNRKKPVKRDTARRYGVPKEQWKTVYNIPAWTYGWSTSIRITEGLANVSKYITKYVTKDSEKIFGNYYFAGGHDLERDVPFYVTDVANPHTIPAERHCELKDLDLYLKYLTNLREKDKYIIDQLGL